jgi:hypothetical protein
MDGIRAQNRRLLFSTLLGLACLCGSPAQAAPMRIVYPPPESATDERSEYSIQLLELALSKAGIDYELQAGKLHMQQGRALKQLEEGAGIDVFWSMTSKQRERDLLAIRIPIDKGLLGWRVFLINTKNRLQFEQVGSLDQLKSFAAGQGHDWPDTEILQANGLTVRSSFSYDSLFKMLQSGRFDYFPRSIEEIWGEEKSHPDMDLEIEQNIVLQYPAAKYFFVNKRNTSLASALETGLRAAIRDGTFEQLFTKYNGALISRAKLQSRKLFKLKNPLLPPETPLQQKELWFKTSP